MKVLWLGAGASKKADYPLTSDLLDAMETLFRREESDLLTLEAWKRFCAYRTESVGTERMLLYSPNPEVILSLPDLYGAALEADNDSIERDAFDTGRQLVREGAGTQQFKDEGARIQGRYDAEGRVPLDSAVMARRDFLIALDAFFAQLHGRDAQPEERYRRDYLRAEFADLEPGDVIISTNWDTIAERTLMEDGRWTPTDGYGFHVQLADAWAAHGCQVDTLPPWVPQQSEIRVLKLHGSFGWRVQDDFGPKIVEQGHIFLDHGQFLGSMCFQNHEEICCVRDRAEPEFYNPSNGPVFVVPSYLKQLTGVSMQHVWYEAHQALMHATRVDVLGAGLPASDVAIRALLNPLRFRAEKKQVQVAIHDPSRASRGRWTRFIGPSVIEYARCAGDPR